MGINCLTVVEWRGLLAEFGIIGTACNCCTIQWEAWCASTKSTSEWRKLAAWNNWGHFRASSSQLKIVEKDKHSCLETLCKDPQICLQFQFLPCELIWLRTQKYACELHETPSIQSAKTSGEKNWIYAEFPPILEGFSNIHEALLVFPDNPLPTHLNIHTGLILYWPYYSTAHAAELKDWSH